MIKAGVIGHPIAHSLSPALHGFWLNQYRIEGEYKAYDISPHALPDFMTSLKENQMAGCNVTIPHKTSVMAYLDEIDEMSAAIGAVNTIIVRGGKLHGTNTDAYGFIENISPHLRGKHKAVVLGAGGASRAVCYGLAQAGFQEIIVTNRTYDAVANLSAPFRPVPWEERSASLANADLLVNTTSLGMIGKPSLAIDLAALPVSALVTDIVYNPLMTPLLNEAKARGNRVVDGLGMLLHQAAAGFEAWFGRKPEVTNALREHILAS